jgi:hypothetical protein
MARSTTAWRGSSANASPSRSTKPRPTRPRRESHRRRDVRPTPQPSKLASANRPRSSLIRQPHHTKNESAPAAESPQHHPCTRGHQSFRRARIFPVQPFSGLAQRRASIARLALDLPPGRPRERQGPRAGRRDAAYASSPRAGRAGDARAHDRRRRRMVTSIEIEGARPRRPPSRACERDAPAQGHGRKHGSDRSRDAKLLIPRGALRMPHPCPRHRCNGCRKIVELSSIGSALPRTNICRRAAGAASSGSSSAGTTGAGVTSITAGSRGVAGASAAII